MEWHDEGIVLSSRPHGENAAVVTLLTAAHGKHAGLVPGGQGRAARPTLQPGNRVQAQWRARVVDQLGTYTLDLTAAQSALWLDEPEILALIASACASSSCCRRARRCCLTSAPTSSGSDAAGVPGRRL